MGIQHCHFSAKPYDVTICLNYLSIILDYTQSSYGSHQTLTLWMSNNVFYICFLSNMPQSHCFQPKCFDMQCVKHFGSQMRPHILWVLILIQIICKGHQNLLLADKCYFPVCILQHKDLISTQYVLITKITRLNIL